MEVSLGLEGRVGQQTESTNSDQNAREKMMEKVMDGEKR